MFSSWRKNSQPDAMISAKKVSELGLFRMAGEIGSGGLFAPDLPSRGERGNVIVLKSNFFSFLQSTDLDMKAASRQNIGASWSQIADDVFWNNVYMENPSMFDFSWESLEQKTRAKIRTTPLCIIPQNPSKVFSGDWEIFEGKAIGSSFRSASNLGYDFWKSNAIANIYLSTLFLSSNYGKHERGLNVIRHGVIGFAAKMADEEQEALCKQAHLLLQRLGEAQRDSKRPQRLVSMNLLHHRLGPWNEQSMIFNQNFVWARAFQRLNTTGQSDPPQFCSLFLPANTDQHMFSALDYDRKMNQDAMCCYASWVINDAIAMLAELTSSEEVEVKGWSGDDIAYSFDGEPDQIYLHYLMGRFASLREDLLETVLRAKMIYRHPNSLQSRFLLTNGASLKAVQAIVHVSMREKLKEQTLSTRDDGIFDQFVEIVFCEAESYIPSVLDEIHIEAEWVGWRGLLCALARRLNEAFKQKRSPLSYYFIRGVLRLIFLLTECLDPLTLTRDGLRRLERVQVSINLLQTLLLSEELEIISATSGPTDGSPNEPPRTPTTLQRFMEKAAANATSATASPASGGTPRRGFSRGTSLMVASLLNEILGVGVLINCKSGSLDSYLKLCILGS